MKSKKTDFNPYFRLRDEVEDFIKIKNEGENDGK